MKSLKLQHHNVSTSLKYPPYIPGVSVPNLSHSTISVTPQSSHGHKNIRGERENGFELGFNQLFSEGRGRMSTLLAQRVALPSPPIVQIRHVHVTSGILIGICGIGSASTFEVRRLRELILAFPVDDNCGNGRWNGARELGR